MILSEVYRRAEVALRLGYVDYARLSASEVLRSFPEDLRALRIAMQAAVEAGDTPSALRHAQVTLRIAPDDTTALATIGVLVASSGETERALVTLDRAYRLSPDCPEVLEPLQVLYRRSRRRTPALDPAPHLAIARWRMRRHEYGGALAELRRAEVETDDVDLVGLIYLLRCEALWRAGRLDQAEQVARALLRDFPTWLKPRLLLGALLLSDPTRTEEGATLLHEALCADPSQTIAQPLFAETPLQIPALAQMLSVAPASHGLATPTDVENAVMSLPPEAFAPTPDDWTPPDTNVEIPSEDVEGLEALESTLLTIASHRPTSRRIDQSSEESVDGDLASSEFALQDDRIGQSAPRRGDRAPVGRRGASSLDPPSLAVLAAMAALAAESADRAETASAWEASIAGVTERPEVSAWRAAIESDAVAVDDRPELTSTSFPFEPFPLKVAARTVELWVTSRSRLTARYGQAGFRQVAAAMERSARALAAIGSQVHLLVVDDQVSTSRYGRRPVAARQPEAVRDLIGAAGAVIVSEWYEVNAVLLIGGDDIIPFFRLPNPSEDDDSDVPSDNPYGARSGNLYIPDFAVGRLPDANERHPSILCAQIEALPERRTRSFGASVGGIWKPWSRIAQRWSRSRIGSAGCASLSCQPVAAEVFSAIGDRSRLELSPPLTSDSLDPQAISGRPLLYFNLIGSRDSARWYGHKDASYPDDYPTLPIALEPRNLAEAQVQDAVVFSESSYGAHVIGKSAENSLALRFLEEGAAAMVGPTAMSYGALQPPVTGADLLGILLWRHLLNGQPLGEALRHAKVDFFATIRERHGWLDGDEQKTLLEFVLYGDPLLAVRAKVRSQIAEPATGGATAVLCQRTSGEGQAAAVNPTIERRVIDHLVETCGSRPSRLRFARHVHCRGECANECHQGIDRPTHPREAVLCATATRTLRTADGLRIHRFMRVTLDRSGQVAKTLISK